jgi:hypothetical protein
MTTEELRKLVTSAYAVVEEVAIGNSEQVVAVLLGRALADTPPNELRQALMEYQPPEPQGWKTR